jgi:hypothetical protein
MLFECHLFLKVLGAVCYDVIRKVNIRHPGRGSNVSARMSVRTQDKHKKGKEFAIL